MGTFRFLLAFAVVISHTRAIYGFTGFGGGPAVIAFFVISGFYMHLVLDTKYEGRTLVFYMNRALRLFPDYWTLLALMTGLAAVTTAVDAGMSLHVFQRFGTSPGIAAMAAVPNIAIIGTDLFRQFLYYPTGETPSIVWQHALQPDGAMPAYFFLAAPQMWSVANEIAFYLLAPFIARMRHISFAVIVLVALALFGFSWNTQLAWRSLLPTYNFFYFMLGMAIYRLLPFYLNLPRAALWCIAVIPFCYWLVTGALAPFPPVLHVLWYLPYAAAIPALFVVSKDSATDRWLGELSYPVYVFHVLFAARNFDTDWSPFIVLAEAVALSILVMKFIDRPIEGWRHRLRSADDRPRNKEPGDAVVPAL